MTSCPEHPELTFDPVSTAAEGIALAAIHDQLQHGTATAGPAVPATRLEYEMNEQDPTVGAATSAEITDVDEEKHTAVVVPEGTHLPEWDHEPEMYYSSGEVFGSAAEVDAYEAEHFGTVDELDHEDALIENAYRNAHGGDEPPTSWSPHSGETVPFEVDQDDLYALLSLDQDDVARFFFEAAPEDASASEVEHEAHLSDPNPSGQAALDYDPEREAVPEVVPNHRDYVEMYGGGMTGDIDELRAEADALDQQQAAAEFAMAEVSYEEPVEETVDIIAPGFF